MNRSDNSDFYLYGDDPNQLPTGAYQSERKDRAHFAVGACHSDEISDIRKAMQKADARMYEIKAEYYSRHPEFEWHSKLG